MYVYIYMSVLINYNDLDATSLECMVSDGKLLPIVSPSFQVGELWSHIRPHTYIYILYISIYIYMIIYICIKYYIDSFI